VSAKRVFRIWDGFATFSRLVRCFYKAARSKFDGEAVLRFYGDLEANLIQMRTDLLDERYQWGAYREFWVVDPKLRKIESAPFRDRVVHHAIHEVLEPLFDPSFYTHSYACRSGRGSHSAVQQLRRWIGNHPDGYYLQMDVAKYFPSVDRGVLFTKIEKRVGDPIFLRLIRSLLRASPGACGIPIGNLTSQLFANLYLDTLDQFIKRELRVPRYVRYMDDLVLLSPSLDELRIWRKKIEEIGQDQLKLRFHPHKVSLGRVRDGVSFLGYRTYPSRVAVRGKNFRRFRKKMKQNRPLDDKVKSLLSYSGHLRFANEGPRLFEELKTIAFRKEKFMI
jgi:RNA-directed DNA polymerase